MPKNDEILKEFDESRRDFIRKAASTSFVAPVVASFTMAGLMSRPAAAQSNSSIPA